MTVGASSTLVIDRFDRSGSASELVVSVERGTFRVTPSGVEPQRYLLRSGSSDKSVDAKLTYDWVHGRVFGEARGSPLELAIEPGTQDVLSIRAAILVDLLAGR